jgi:hypothetical protein
MRCAMRMPCSSQSSGSLEATVVRARQRNCRRGLLRTQREMKDCESETCCSKAGHLSCSTASMTQRMMCELSGVPARRSFSKMSQIASSAPGADCSAGDGPLAVARARPASSSMRRVSSSLPSLSNHDATVEWDRFTYRSSGALFFRYSTVARALPPCFTCACRMSLIHGELNHRVYLPRLLSGTRRSRASAAAAATSTDSADRFSLGLPTVCLGGGVTARGGGCSLSCSAMSRCCWRYAATSMREKNACMAD